MVGQVSHSAVAPLHAAIDAFLVLEYGQGAFTDSGPSQIGL